MAYEPSEPERAAEITERIDRALLAARLYLPHRHGGPAQALHCVCHNVRPRQGRRGYVRIPNWRDGC